MTFRKANFVAYRVGFRVAAAAVLFAVGSASVLFAQQANFDQLTKENLIGNAVSFSNNDYAEIDKAIQRFRNGDGQGAMEFLKTAKEKYPSLPPAELIYAKMHFAIRNANAARAGQILLEQTVAQVPDDPEAYLLLADQAFAGRRIAEAHALFEMVDPLVQKFSGNAKRKQDFSIRVLAGRAAIAESRQQWEEAQKWLLEWAELSPESAAAHRRLGATLFHLKKPKEALERFRKSRELDPSVSHPFVALGQLFSREGDAENAQKSFEKAYAEDKDDPSTAQAYVEWLVQENKLDEAQAIANAMRELTPDSVTALMLDGIVAQMRGDTEQSKQAMTKILTLDPAHFIATDLLALLLIESDLAADQDRALSYAEMNAQRFPENARANITKAWVLYKMGRNEEFKLALEKVGRNQVPLDSAFLIAKIMVEQGKKDAAINELEKLMQQGSGLFVFRREAEALLTQLKSE